jgi:hypothetical protein
MNELHQLAKPANKSIGPKAEATIYSRYDGIVAGVTIRAAVVSLKFER